MLQWLESLGFDAATIEKYAGVFGREGIDERVLKQITLEQLVTLGVMTYGHRVLLQNSARAGMYIGSCMYSFSSSTGLHVCRRSCISSLDAEVGEVGLGQCSSFFA